MFKYSKCYIINLDHDKDRLIHMKKECLKNHIEFERISAISPTHYKEYNGQVGCFLSHINALELSQKNNYDSVLILEDDCTFDSNFTFLVNEYFKEIESYQIHFDLAYFHNINDPNNPRITPNIFQVKQYCTHALLITKGGYKKILNAFKKIKTFINYPYDYFLNDINMLRIAPSKNMISQCLYFLSNIPTSKRDTVYARLRWKKNEIN